MTRRALSLHARQLLAASLGLVAFLGLTGYALDQAFKETALSNLRERFNSYIYAYYSAIDFTRGGELIPITAEMQPDERFSRPGGGLYVQLRGEKGLRWDSTSALGEGLPEPPPFKAGQVLFDGPIDYVNAKGQRRSVYRLSQAIVREMVMGRSSRRFLH